MKGLPMTYNRDMQEDKEPLFDAADQLCGSLEMAREVVESREAENLSPPQRPKRVGWSRRIWRKRWPQRHAVSSGAPDCGTPGA